VVADAMVVVPNATIAASAMLDFMVASKLTPRRLSEPHLAPVIRGYPCRRYPLD
jgi:hypothetical protein